MRNLLRTLSCTLVFSNIYPAACYDLVDPLSTALGFDVCLPLNPFPQPAPLPTCSLSSSPVELDSTPEFLSFEQWKEKQIASQRTNEVNESHASTATFSSSINQTNQQSQAERNKELETTQSIQDHPENSSKPTTDSNSIATYLPRSHIPLIDRFNYASDECNARIHSAHKSAKGAHSILSRKKDKYMLSPCITSEKKFVIVELCEDIRIDTVQLANFEFFSGIFQDIKVSVAHSDPNDEKAWVTMGEYKAKNIRGVQSFHYTQDMPYFYRYIRIDFLSHYGAEYYCPVSLLRVYGLTPMEEFKYDEWVAEWKASVHTTAQQVDTTVSTPSSESVRTASTENSPAVDTSQQGSLLQTSLNVKANDLPTAFPGEVTNNTPIIKEGSNSPSSSMPSTSSESIPISTTDKAGQSAAVVTTDSSNSDSSTSHDSAPTRHVSSNGSSVPIITTTKVITSLSVAIATPSPAVGALGGESVYRMIINRLTNLEGNQTLYARYVEEQARSVDQRLQNLEQEVGRLGALAKTQQAAMVRMLERFRLDLENEQTQLALKLDSLSHDVMLEKRLGIVQLVLLATVLVFMALTRGSRADDPHLRRTPRLERTTPRSWTRGLRDSGDWIIQGWRSRATSGLDESATRGARSSTVSLLPPLSLERRSRSRRDSDKALRPSLLSDQPRSTSQPRRRSGTPPHRSSTPDRTPLLDANASPKSKLQPRQANIQHLKRQLAVFGGRSISTSGRASGQVIVPGSARRLAKTAHLHEVKDRSRQEGVKLESSPLARRNSEERVLLPETFKIPFPLTPSKLDDDDETAWADEPPTDGEHSSPTRSEIFRRPSGILSLPSQVNG